MSTDATDRAEVGKVGGTRAYTGQVISVDRDLVRFPDGSTGELEMVRHPGASAIVPFLNDPSSPNPEILLIHQYRYAASGFLFEIPAGRLERGEDPLACAERELREETGYGAARFEPLMTMFTTPGFTDERIHVFLAADLTQGAASPERDEFVELVPTRLEKALAMIREGTIQDAKSALSIMFAARFRARL
jgi:ADP-ribose pyrophosphatase